MQNKTSKSDIFEGEVKSPFPKVPENSVDLHGRWTIECRGKNGLLKWVEVIENMVVNTGLDLALASTLTGGTRYTTWYVGLTAATPTANAADTPASHAGWTEFVAYSEATRQTWTPGSITSQSVSNSASKAIFTISQDAQTVGGAFLITDSAKGGTDGVLYSIGAFSGGNKSVDNSDTISITATFSAADDGV